MRFVGVGGWLVCGALILTDRVTYLIPLNLNYIYAQVALLNRCNDVVRNVIINVIIWYHASGRHEFQNPPPRVIFLVFEL